MSTDKQKGKKDSLIAGYHSHRFCHAKQAWKVTRLCNSSAKTLFMLTIPPAKWARVVIIIIEINSILTGKTGLLYFLSSTLVLDKKLVHVVYSKVDRDVLVIAMPSERYFVTLLFTPV